MRELLEGLLPKVVPPHVPFYLLTHEGKTDLERSIPRKLRGWNTPGAQFIVLRDKDAADCRRLKAGLRKLCVVGGKPGALIRIVCHELETWCLGDLKAVELAFGRSGLARLQNRERFRDPDRFANAAQELKRLVPGYQKVSGARSIGQHLDPGGNRSQSFNVFLTGLATLLAGMPSPQEGLE